MIMILRHKRTYYAVDFAVLADRRAKIKESEKINFLDLASELKKKTKT